MSNNLDTDAGAVLAGPGRVPGEVRPEALALMKRAVAARREGDLERTLALARAAMRADPTASLVQEFYRIAVADQAKTRGENPRVLEDFAQATRAKQEGRWEAAIAHMEAAARMDPHPNVLKALERLKADAEAARNKAGFMGASDFVGGLRHYMGKSGKPRRVDFSELDTSRVNISDFHQFRLGLKNSKGGSRVRIKGKTAWRAKGYQWLLLGRITLTLEGTLDVHEDCRWTFNGFLSARDDYYDFNKSDRDALGEGLTALGRALPGAPYKIGIVGSKPIRETGAKEDCP